MMGAIAVLLGGFAVAGSIQAIQNGVITAAGWWWMALVGSLFASCQVIGSVILATLVLGSETRPKDKTSNSK
jgi:hypothetical protein